MASIRRQTLWYLSSLLLLSLFGPAFGSPTSCGTVNVPTDPSFDISRIQNFEDKETLAKFSEYFITFSTGDYDAMDALQANSFHITDIPLGLVRLSKSDWYNANKGFTSLMTGISVQAISISGSSKPGSFAIMENLVSFTLAVDPPDQAKPNLPPGIKKGDSASMIMLSAVWWNDQGKITRDLEYGKLTWPDFNITSFEAV